MTMALFVTGVSTAIHMYSIGYMHRDPGFDRFFVYLNLFLFSMVVLVLADNFLFSFLGWEGVGFCSYGLVGFWFQRETAAVAAKKAFVTNRVGDVGFLLAMFLMFAHFSSVNYSTVLGPALSGHRHGLLTAGRGHKRHDGDRHNPAALPRRAWASRPRSPCTSGSPTPWKARRRSRPSSMPPPWSPPAST